MKPLERIIEAARRSPKHIVLAEGEDPRIVEGACRAARDGLAHITLIGGRAAVERRLAAQGVEPGLLRVEDPATSERTAGYAAAYHALRAAKGVSEAAAHDAMANPLVPSAAASSADTRQPDR